MTSKGVYPYDYMDSFDKFNEFLPKKEDFYSIINDELISEENYKRAKKSVEHFQFRKHGTVS